MAGIHALLTLKGFSLGSGACRQPRRLQPMLYHFDDCELDTQLFRRRREGVPLQLRPKVFRVLTHLLEHRHRVVTRQQLFEHVWPKQFVSGPALGSCIKAVRQAIGDSGARPRLIQTVRGYGNRFMAAVEACEASPAPCRRWPNPAQFSVAIPQLAWCRGPRTWRPAGSGSRAVISDHDRQSPGSRSTTLASRATRGARLESIRRSCARDDDAARAPGTARRRPWTGGGAGGRARYWQVATGV
jgi:DNA-binding winged helix-turn-helix (wHTH) protein